MSEFEVVLERQWKLLSVLTTSQEGMTLQELSRLFGVSEKTIKRDLITLKKVFGPWKSKNEAHGRKRYRYESQNLTFDEFLDHNELFVLYLGLKLTDALTGTNLGAKAASARQKIEKTIREERIKFADCIAPLCRHWGKFTPKICEVVDAVCLAMEKRFLLRVSYRSIRSEADKTYEICPYRFFYRDKSVYLVGLCCYDRKIKFWKLERMSSAEVLDKQRFKIPENFDPDSYVMNGVESVGTPTIRFTGFAARTVPEEHAGHILDIKREKSGKKPVQLLANTGFALTVNGGSGSPYTAARKVLSPIQGGTSLLQGTYNGSRMPASFRFDLRVDKDINFTLGGKEEGKKGHDVFFNVYLQVLNLLNSKNIMNVYSATGNPNDDGYLSAPEWQREINEQLDPQAFIQMYELYVDNGGNYSTPRQIRVGLSFNF